MRQSKSRPTIVPVTLREVYTCPGDYSAKLLVGSARSRRIDDVEVTMTGPDGRSMLIDARRWGTKLNLEFNVADDTPDGVAIIEVRLIEGSTVVTERFDCWLITK